MFSLQIFFGKCWFISSLVLFSDEPHEVDQRHKIVGLLGLFILQHQIYKGIDRRFFSKFWDIHKKVGFRLDPQKKSKKNFKNL